MPSHGCASRVDHVHCFNLLRKFFLPPNVLLARFILVFTWCFPSLVFGIQFAGLLEDPALSVRVVRRFVKGSMNLAQSLGLYSDRTVPLYFL